MLTHLAFLSFLLIPFFFKISRWLLIGPRESTKRRRGETGFRADISQREKGKGREQRHSKVPNELKG